MDRTMRIRVAPTLSQMVRSCFISTGLGGQGTPVAGKLQPERPPGAVARPPGPAEEAAQKCHAPLVGAAFDSEKRAEVKFRAMMRRAALPGDSVPQERGPGLARRALVVAVEGEKGRPGLAHLVIV